MLVFFDIRGIIIFEYVRTILLSGFNEIRNKHSGKRWNLWSHGWLLHQDNTLMYKAILAYQFLTDKWMPILEHASSSPDLAPFDLFPELTSLLKGTHFQQCYTHKLTPGDAKDLEGFCEAMCSFWWKLLWKGTACRYSNLIHEVCFWN